MKILVTADLHLQSHTLTDSFYLNKQKRIINNHLKTQLQQCDLVVVCGDVVESSIIKSKSNPLDGLYSLFERDVIFCLGNHEFAYQKHQDVIKWWGQWDHPHVHCLDIKHSVDIDGVNFVGNVLWYDFTLNENPLIMEGEIIDGWLDSTIEDFDPLKECQKCKDRIRSNVSSLLRNVLVTHMVPDIRLNTFSYSAPKSPYNGYSGCRSFLSELQDLGDITYAVCGHTHRRECLEIGHTNCINIGNDYYFRSGHIDSMLIQI